MEKELQRIAIAQACGWKLSRITQAACGGDVYEDVWFRPGYEPSEQTADWISSFGNINPPDYLTDLNAIHEAVEGLSKRKRDEVIEYLIDVVKATREYLKIEGHPDIAWCQRVREIGNVATATPDQWAEAFLRAVGKWTEES